MDYIVNLVFVLIFMGVSVYSAYLKYENVKMWKENEWLKFGLGEYELKVRKLKEELLDVKGQ